MKILSVVGARPQFIKLAALVRAFDRSTHSLRCTHSVLHTGQHYDAALSDIFFRDLDLPAAQFHLGVGSAPHGKQTGMMLDGIERVLIDAKPDLLVVYGDTNSTLAGALAAAKQRTPVVHVEAGLRSFRRDMPEEINRIVADHVCDLLLAPTATAMTNLATEGLGERARLTGDLMLDSVLHYRAIADQRASVGRSLGLEGGTFGFVTVHRVQNTDDPGRFSSLLAVFNRIADRGVTLVFPVHPRTRERMNCQPSRWVPHPRILLIEPVAYLDTLWLLGNARFVLTDSGGLQKEAFFLGCPCVTLREETEWVETLSIGGNQLVGSDPEAIFGASMEALQREGESRKTVSAAALDAFGSGIASQRIVDALLRFAGEGKARARTRAKATRPDEQSIRVE